MKIYYYKNYKNEMIVAGLLALISALISFLISIITGYLFSRPALCRNGISVFLPFLIVILASMTINYLSETRFKIINLKMLSSHMPSVWRHILFIPPSESKKFNLTDLNHLLTHYTAALSTIFSSTFSVLSNIMLILLLFGYLFYCDGYLAFAYILLLSLLLCGKIAYYPTLKNLTQCVLNREAQSVTFLNEALSQIHKLKTANLEEVTHKKWQKLALDSKKIHIRIFRIDSIFWLIENITFAVLILIALYSHVNITFLICVTQLILYYEKLANDLPNVFHKLIALKQLSPILNLAIFQPQLTHQIMTFAGEITLLNISNYALKNISLTIPANSFVAFTGETGSGKSSIFRLLLGLEEPISGTILFDNININDLNVNDLRKHFGVVLQTTRLFPGTIYSNLCVNRKITLDEAWALVRFVGIEDEINAMPMKMFTYISDNAGDSLSGGQRQKILIARALVTQPKVLFLDEATSALDEASQALIFKNLKSLNITLVVIAHRLSTILDADRVYLLKDGQLFKPKLSNQSINTTKFIS